MASRKYILNVKDYIYEISQVNVIRQNASEAQILIDGVLPIEQEILSLFSFIWDHLYDFANVEQCK